jgi:hypothetical protein
MCVPKFAFKKPQKRTQERTPTVGVENFSRKEPQKWNGPLPEPVRVSTVPQGTARSQIASAALRLGVVLWFLWWLLGRH